MRSLHVAGCSVLPQAQSGNDVALTVETRRTGHAAQLHSAHGAVFVAVPPEISGNSESVPGIHGYAIIFRCGNIQTRVPAQVCIVGYLYDKLFGRSASKVSAGGQSNVNANLDTPTLISVSYDANRDNVVALALADRDQGQFASALARVRLALDVSGDEGELAFVKGTILSAWGRHREALDAFRMAESLGKTDAAFHVGLGLAASAVQKLDVAIDSMRKAVRQEPDERRWQYWLGTFLNSAGQTSEAIACFESIVAADAANVDAIVEMCRCYIRADDPRAGEEQALRAVEIAPGRADAWGLLGITLAMQDRELEGLEKLAHAEMLDRGLNRLELFDQRAVALAALGRTQECIEVLESNLPNRPNPNGHLQYAPALLVEGRHLDGWTQFEFRWFTEPLASLWPNYGKPEWAGQNLAGKTIFVRAEQGYGDIFQMLRYLPLMKAQGATILLQPIEILEPMYGQLDGVDSILAADQPLPHFDYWTHLMSLPRIFGTSEATVPANVPYLRANPDYLTRWAPRIPDDSILNIGIVWTGNPKQRSNRRRSLVLEQLLPVLRVPNTRFFSLQKGPAAAHADVAIPGVNLINLASQISDFGDTAAAIEHLDLLISTCTSVPHLAGALGKPVWLMLSEPADYRWLRQREDTPWYPTMRLFRQSRPKHWDEVIERVRVELHELAAMKQAGATREAIAAHARPSGSTQPRSVRMPEVRRVPPGVATAAQTRAGLMQFVAEHGTEGRSLHWYGEYLYPQLERLLRLVRPGQMLLEAGAGFGMHSIMLARALGTEGHIVLYEPNAIARRVLGNNLAVNRIANATVMNRGLGPAASAANGLAEAGSAEPSPACDTIDELQFDRLDWLKTNPGVDTVGVLRGARETLWRLRSCMLLSASSESVLETIASTCKELGYRVWRLDTPLFDPRNFNCRSHDIFKGMIAMAVLAIPEENDVSLVASPLIEL